MAISDLAQPPDEKLVEAFESEQIKKPKDKKNKTHENGTRQTAKWEGERVNGRTGARANVSTRERENALYTTAAKQRIRVRSSFEMYQDQVVKLNELEINAKMKGEKFSKSDISSETPQP